MAKDNNEKQKTTTLLDGQFRKVQNHTNNNQRALELEEGPALPCKPTQSIDWVGLVTRVLPFEEYVFIGYMVTTGNLPSFFGECLLLRVYVSVAYQQEQSVTHWYTTCHRTKLTPALCKRLR